MSELGFSRMRYSPTRFLMAGLLLIGTFMAWQFMATAPNLQAFSTQEAMRAAGAGPVPEASLLSAQWLHLKPGGTPANALIQAGIKVGDTHRVLSALGQIMPLGNIQPRDAITLFSSREGNLVGLELQRFPQRKIVVDETPTGFVAHREILPTQKRVRRLEERVRSTLYEAIHRSGGDDAVLASFSELFAWDFDFSTETREGDTFALLLEETWVEGQRLGGGKVLYGRYTPVGSKPLGAYFYEGPTKELVGYFNHRGEAIQKRFLRSPLNFTRISSHFTRNRMHPILKKLRPHLGIDYAAPTGTPVVAIGSGRVTFAGWIKGFGKTVKVQHGDGYLSQYAHLSRIRVKKNARIAQNDVIGNVGSTGMATGPHLDFRVRKDRTWINSLHLKGGSAAPLPQAHRVPFLAYVAEINQVFSGLGPGESLAWTGREALEGSGPIAE